MRIDYYNALTADGYKDFTGIVAEEVDRSLEMYLKVI